MSCAPVRDRAARTRAARRPGARVSLRGSIGNRPATPADVAAVHATNTARAALADAATNAAVFGNGSPQHREALDVLRAAMTNENIAHVRAEVDRARRRRSAASLRVALAYIAYRRDVTGTADADDYDLSSSLADASIREIDELATLLEYLLTVDAITSDDRTARADTSDAPENGPPTPAALFVDTLTIAPGAPSVPALSAH
ncbi:hypothetical protein G4H71_13300 [Rhodococcus triatomae]|nr:hypothetical protein [Rhodococcus triatomae]QNG20215.1 hypothetical protein G4H72_17080 [Rhodococcus triatomae]QNG23870.1 hypothetical protein G4H71_13300 [Rhodococcus triatomae]